MRTALVILGSLVLAAGTATAQPPADPFGPPPADRSSPMPSAPSQGRLGIAVLELSSELRSYFGAPRDRGVLVDRVRPGSPADRAGVRVGDLVTEVDGEPTASAPDLLRAMADRRRGERIDVRIVRRGQERTLRATLQNEPGGGIVGPPRAQPLPDRGDLDDRDDLDDDDRRRADDEDEDEDEAGSARERALERRIRELEDRLERLDRAKRGDRT